MVEGPAGATSGVGGTAPDPYVTGRVADVDWAARAGSAERAIVRRHLRRLGGVVPGTRIGRIRWPRLPPVKPWPWHYWWQAHLLDCLVDAQLRSPRPGRADTIAAVARTVRLRNLGSWTNDYYDDVAWFGLAVQRAGPLAGRSTPPALSAITARLGAGWTPAGGGGIWWRRGDTSGPAGSAGPLSSEVSEPGPACGRSPRGALDAPDQGSSQGRSGQNAGVAMTRDDGGYAAVIRQAVHDAVHALLTAPPDSLAGLRALREVTMPLAAEHGAAAATDLAEELAADLAEAFEALAAAEGRSAMVVLVSWFHDIPEPFSATAAPTDIGGHQDADRGPDRPERHRDETP